MGLLTESQKQANETMVWRKLGEQDANRTSNATPRIAPRIESPAEKKVSWKNRAVWAITALALISGLVMSLTDKPENKTIPSPEPDTPGLMK